MSEQHSGNVNPLSDMIGGLSEAEGIAVLDDIAIFGTAMVKVTDGAKQRIPPHQWPTSEQVSKMIDEYDALDVKRD